MSFVVCTVEGLRPKRLLTMLAMRPLPVRLWVLRVLRVLRATWRYGCQDGGTDKDDGCGLSARKE